MKGRRQQQSEFIFINGQRAERELLKKKRKMNERISEMGGGWRRRRRKDAVFAPPSILKSNNNAEEWASCWNGRRRQPAKRPDRGSREKTAHSAAMLAAQQHWCLELKANTSMLTSSKSGYISQYNDIMVPVRLCFVLTK